MLKKTLMGLAALGLLAGGTAACDDDDDVVAPEPEIAVDLVNEHFASITMAVEGGTQFVISAGAQESVTVDDPGTGESIRFFAELEGVTQSIDCPVSADTSSPDVVFTVNGALECRDW